MHRKSKTSCLLLRGIGCTCKCSLRTINSQRIKYARAVRAKTLDGQKDREGRSGQLQVSGQSQHPAGDEAGQGESRAGKGSLASKARRRQRHRDASHPGPATAAIAGGAQQPSKGPAANALQHRLEKLL